MLNDRETYSLQRDASPTVSSAALHSGGFSKIKFFFLSIQYKLQQYIAVVLIIIIIIIICIDKNGCPPS